MKTSVLYSAILVALVGSFLTYADTVPFRSGTVYSCELSNKTTKIENKERVQVPRFSDAAFAQVVFKLNPGRSLSIYDYVLKDSSKKYPCVALAEGNGTFDAAMTKIPAGSTDKFYRMLFIVQRPAGLKIPQYDLALDLFPSNLPPATLPFMDMGKEDFCTMADIPEKGHVGASPAKILEKRRKLNEMLKPKEKPKPKEDTKKTTKKDDKKSSQARRVVVMIDFGEDNKKSGDHWNNMTNPEKGKINNMVDSDGKKTGIKIAITKRFNAKNYNGTKKPGISVKMPASATQDSFFGNTKEFNGKTAPKATIKLTGLKKDTSYSFYFFASRSGVDDKRVAKYSVSGAGSAKSCNLDASNNDGTVEPVTDVKPNSKGEITISAEAADDNNNPNKFYYLGAFKIIYETK